MNYPKSIYSEFDGIQFGYELHEYEESISLIIKDVNGFELEDIVTYKKNGKLKSHIKNLHTSLFQSIPDFIEKYPEVYKYVLEQDEEQRWSSLIDIIGLCLPDYLNHGEVTTATWILERSRLTEYEKTQLKFDVEPFYRLQEEIGTKVIVKNDLPDEINYIAGADLAYDDEKNKMVGAFVVLDANTLSVVERAHYVMNITFPYVPGLFSFREIPPLVEAFKQLTIEPDLIVCNGQGIAHQKGVGMATHLGVELNIPTIGCTQKRLVGVFDRNALLPERGKFQHLIWNDQVVGAALRTQNAVNPVFVSVGHKIDLTTSMDWILRLSDKHRLPETEIQSDQIVKRLINRSNGLNLFSDPD